MTAPVGGRRPLYDRVAEETAGVVIRRYSTSFGLASRLLGRGVRRHVENIYALVRVADEIVDGGAAESGADADATATILDDFESATERAVEIGFSANLVVHAFALTARSVGIGSDLTRPFFASMRADLTDVVHDRRSFDEYVYGSAEVVGLMCLRAFLADGAGGTTASSRTETDAAALVTGARRLGAAFQKVNFLRDLAADFEELGRSYFPDVDVASFDEPAKIRILDDIDADLRASAQVIPMLPRSSRRAVLLAQGLFVELSRRLRATPADRLVRTRVRVPDAVKLRIAASAAVGRPTAVARVGA